MPPVPTLPLVYVNPSKNRSIVGQVVGDGRGRERLQKPPAVAHRPQARVQHREHAAVVPMTDQAAQPLQQRQDRQRDLVVVNASPPPASTASMRAAVIGSPGEANGSLSMTTQLS